MIAANIYSVPEVTTLRRFINRFIIIIIIIIIMGGLLCTVQTEQMRCRTSNLEVIYHYGRITAYSVLGTFSMGHLYVRIGKNGRRLTVIRTEY